MCKNAEVSNGNYQTKIQSSISVYCGKFDGTFMTLTWTNKL